MATANIYYGYDTGENTSESTPNVFHLNLKEEDASPLVVIDALRDCASDLRSSKELIGELFITAGKDYEEYVDFVIGQLDNPTYKYRIIDLGCELELDPNYVEGGHGKFHVGVPESKKTDINNTRIEVILEDEVDEKDADALIKKYTEQYGSLGEIVIGEGEEKIVYSKEGVSPEKLKADMAKIAGETSESTGKDVIGIARNMNGRPAIVVRYDAIVLKAPLRPKKNAQAPD